jgi:hypothetical protein
MTSGLVPAFMPRPVLWVPLTPAVHRNPVLAWNAALRQARRGWLRQVRGQRARDAATMTRCPHGVRTSAVPPPDRRERLFESAASPQVKRRVWDSNPRSRSLATAVFKTRNQNARTCWDFLRTPDLGTYRACSGAGRAICATPLYQPGLTLASRRRRLPNGPGTAWTFCSGSTRSASPGSRTWPGDASMTRPGRQSRMEAPPTPSLAKNGGATRGNRPGPLSADGPGALCTQADTTARRVPARTRRRCPSGGTRRGLVFQHL